MEELHHEQQGVRRTSIAARISGAFKEYRLRKHLESTGQLPDDSNEAMSGREAAKLVLDPRVIDSVVTRKLGTPEDPVYVKVLLDPRVE